MIYDDNHIVINIDLLFERIEYNKSILHDFIKANNLPIDFLNSSFNVSELAAFNYIYDSCSYHNDNDVVCICEKYYNCKNIQKYILNNPLMFIIINKKNIDKICYDIKKYNLFSFDGKINNSFSLDLTTYTLKEAHEHLLLMMSFNHVDISMKTLLFINIFYNIYVKYYNLLKFIKFRNIIYSKIIELKEFDFNSKYWFDKLNLDPNLLDIIDGSLCEYFPLEK